MKKTININVGDHSIKIETKRWAKQSNGSAVVTYKDNIILATANMKDEVKEGQDFFPLMVDFRENNYSAGKIPGGFFKREGKPSEKEVLMSRLIDRPIRPLFPEEFNNETQIISNLLSADFSVDYDSLGIISASAALLSSTIPFNTPVGAVKVGRKDGQFVINPGTDVIAEMDMVVQIAGTADDIVMLEAGGLEFSEDELKECLVFGKEIIIDICTAQEELINPDKLVVEKDAELEEIYNELAPKLKAEINEAVYTIDRDSRKAKLKDISDRTLEGVDEDKIAKYKKVLHKFEYETFRETLIKEKKRNDGRALDEIRKISIELGVLPRVHGSAVFTRGETQALATVTLGGEDDAQRIDTISTSGQLKKFMLHYNFPPYSVGEVSFLRGTGRREVGHGNLAEKGLKNVFPSEEEFPYTVRLVSDIMESNGSSSMATVCGGTLALMDAGVPIKSPVSGIAMGLVKEGDEFAVLTDIAGYEDHFGDMDFKITGTRKGITAVQLDIKIDGLDDEIITKTLDDAKKARLFILDKMEAAIATPNKEVSEFAPVILTIHINKDKIRDLIGPGGKTIKELVATYGAKVNTDDEGKVTVAAPNMEVGQQVVERIEEITASIEVEKIYNGKITRIEEYGVFVELIPGSTGLLHISEISNKRIKSIKDMNYKLGEKLEVKVIGVDRDNKIKISRKELENS